MSAPAYQTADYVFALQQLMPRGAAWPRDPDAVLTALLTGLAPTFEASDDAGAALLVSSFPATATDLLPEWEATLGQPARFGGAVGTITQRQSDVASSLGGVGGQSIAYFLAYAHHMGYSTIAIYQPGTNTVDSTVDAELAVLSSPFQFIVEVPTGTNAARLRAMLNLYKPAHTTYVVLFT